MKIEIWSDFACPFCYIGKRNFDNALKTLPKAIRDDIQIVNHSFELNPNMPYAEFTSIYEAIAESKGISLEESKKMHDQAAAYAKQSGLQYNFDTQIPGPTKVVHRIMAYAASISQDAQEKVKENFFQGYFTNGKDLNKEEDILEMIQGTGLNQAEVQKIIQSDEYSQNLSQDQDLASAYGIRSVPFFLVNNKYSISGAQPTELFEEAIAKIYEEFKPVVLASGQVCSDEGCSL